MVEPAVDLTHGHAHDDHAHHGPEGWKKYLWSTDHKVIAMQYMFTGMFMALVGGFMAYVFRMQLAFPGIEVPGVRDGRPRGVQRAGHQPRHDHDLLGGHARPAGRLRELLIPLMIGADDMVFPKINRLSFQVFFVSTIVILASLVVEGGGFAGAWTAYPPLSATRRPTTSPRSGVPCG